jgi:hypothetical protein
MRQININKYGLPDAGSVYIKAKQYSVSLGNGSRNYFSSVKEVKRFLAETNRFLNDRLHELNYIYGLLFVEYRNAWFYLQGNEDIEQQITNSIEYLENVFVKTVVKSTGTNGNSFTFNYMFSICKELEHIAKQIFIILKVNHDFADIRRIKLLERQVKQISNEIELYGKSQLT